MNGFRFSRLAEADLLGIAAYTVRTWGEAQADRYLTDLEVFCRKLARTPAMGRPCDEIRPGLQRSECAKHVIFFRRERGGIAISRILHERMSPDRHLFEDD